MSYLSVFLSTSHLEKKRIESQWLQDPVLQNTHWQLVPGFYIHATFNRSLRWCTVTTVFLVSHMTTVACRQLPSTGPV